MPFVDIFLSQSVKSSSVQAPPDRFSASLSFEEVQIKPQGTDHQNIQDRTVRKNDSWYWQLPSAPTGRSPATGTHLQDSPRLAAALRSIHKCLQQPATCFSPQWHMTCFSYPNVNRNSRVITKYFFIRNAQFISMRQ